MRLKYFLRGVGIGLIITTILLAITNRPKAMTDEEIIARAKELGYEQQTIFPALGTGITSPTVPPADSQSSGATNTSGSNETVENGVTSDSGETVGSGVTDDSGETAGELSGESQIATDNTVEANTTEANTTEANTTEANTTEANTTELNTAEVNTTVNSEIESQPETESVSKGPAPNPDKDTTTQEQTTETVTQQTTQYYTLQITGGMSSNKVADALYRNGIIDNSAAFDNYLIGNGYADVIRIGAFNLNSDMSFEQIARTITGR